MRAKDKLIALLIGLLLPLMGAEILLRTTGDQRGINQTDPKTGLSILRPNNEFNWKFDCYDTKVKTNSWGFHGEEFSYDQDAIRIAVIGDSQVESLQVDLDKSFFSLLQDKLEQKLGKKVVVYSFGHSGNGQLLNYFFQENYVTKVKPNLVIDLFSVINDFRDDYQPIAEDYIKRSGDTLILDKPTLNLDSKGDINLQITEDWLKQRQINGINYAVEKTIRQLYLYRWFNQKIKIAKINWNRPKDADTDVAALFPQALLDGEVLRKDYSQIWEDAWKLEEKLLLANKQLAEKDGGHFLLVSSVDQFRHKLMTDNTSVDLFKPEKLFKEISDRNNIMYLPLQAQVSEKLGSEDVSFSCDKGHWTVQTHAIVADVITDYLTQHEELWK